MLYFPSLESLVISDQDFQHEDLNFLSRSERYDAAVRKSAQMILKLREYGISDPEEIYSYKRYAYLSWLKKNLSLSYGIWILCNWWCLEYRKHLSCEIQKKKDKTTS